MRNVVFLHKRTLYFAVTSRKGCVDFSIKYDFINFEFDSRIPQGMRGFENMWQFFFVTASRRTPHGVRGFENRIDDRRPRIMLVAPRTVCVDLRWLIQKIWFWYKKTGYITWYIPLLTQISFFYRFVESGSCPHSNFSFPSWITSIDCQYPSSANSPSDTTQWLDASNAPSGIILQKFP